MQNLARDLFLFQTDFIQNDEIRNRFYDYTFKAGWLILGSLLTYAVIHFNVFSR